jgi:purine-nucleoside phosphorylase
MPTPHNSAKTGEIAKTVLMPGDPLRANFVSEKYLDNAICFNTVRNMLGYTGTYKGKRISVMGGGMGVPSIGLYSYELFNMYNVDNIIRIGSAGGIAGNVNLRDIIIAMGACTNSNYALQYNLAGTFAPTASYKLLDMAAKAAKRIDINPIVGNVLTSDTFYDDNPDSLLPWVKMGVLAVEMETAGLYMNAARANKKALCILTVSDCPLKGESLSAEERQLTFIQMIEIALEIAE